MIDKDTVDACYRAILGRPPENEAVIEEKIRTSPSLEALLRVFIDSPEFSDKVRGPRRTETFAGAPTIDVDVSEAQQAALFECVRRQWRTLGEQEPFWSVSTHEEYRAANLNAASIERFYASGVEHAALIGRFCERTGAALPRRTCLELGCGVGRMTKHLAAQFEKVIAVDISEGNLRECRAMAARAGLSNIDFVLLRSPGDIAAIKPFDVFVSVITLQHNQPPVQKHMLEEVLGNLAPGGVFLFQTQTYYRDYSFSIEDYLRAPPDTMEMHSLPMHEILRLIDRRDCQALEVLEDDWTGRQGSHSFFGTKRAAAGG
jgi:2-polyprenyl-3-methyl-5-hydroxy-6-metoxy-1,4-benzoquinol methylase